MLAWLISSSVVPLRTLVVIVASGLPVLGVVDIKNKPLDVIPELALPSLTVKAELPLGLSSAHVEPRITVPLGSGPAQWRPMASGHSVGMDGRISTIEMIFVPGPI